MKDQSQINMKKASSTILILIFLFSFHSFSQEEENTEKQESPKEDIEALTELKKDTIIKCRAMDILNEKISEDPGLKPKMAAIEKQCQTFVNRCKKEEADHMGTITIPVVVHVIYSNPKEKLTALQIQSQIRVLNKDFSKINTDISKIPEEFKNIASNINVQFNLLDIKKVASKRKTWGTNDDMKFTSKGGSDAVDPTKHLNIWVCNIGTVLGYAQFPGMGDLSTDGIVVSSQYFGTTNAQAPFNKGRTATHEVGHWLNLRHIWGDGNCDQDDFVDDTPMSDRSNFGCPSYPTKHCGSNDMTMNYMDYVDDACMYMFTEGQKYRMRAVFAPGGPRESFVN